MVRQGIRSALKLLKPRYALLFGNPVLVYQMGKVASTSIYESLKMTPGVHAFHMHRMNPENIESVRKSYSQQGIPPLNEDLGLFLFRNLINKRKPVQIISLVREPINRNISAYFQNLDVFMNNNSATVDQYIKNFLESYNHNVPLEWFDAELKTTTGIDVYNYDYPKEKGYVIIEQKPYSLLLMKHDLADTCKEELIRAFLNLSSFKLVRANESSTKDYAQKYQDFLSNIKIPVTYAERMLTSKYARHFYSSEEIQSIFKKWTGVKMGKNLTKEVDRP